MVGRVSDVSVADYIVRRDGAIGQYSSNPINDEDICWEYAIMPAVLHYGTHPSLELVCSFTFNHLYATPSATASSSASTAFSAVAPKPIGPSSQPSTMAW